MAMEHPRHHGFSILAHSLFLYAVGICNANPVCDHSGVKYTFIGNSSFNPGNIFQLADECAKSFNGALYELRDTAAAGQVLADLDSKGCRSETPRAETNGKMIYLAPSATSYRRQMPNHTAFNETQVQSFWKYSNGDSMTKALFRQGEPNNWFNMGEACLVMYSNSSIGNDKPCDEANMTALCVVDSPPNAKGCPLPPTNPTAVTPLPARVVLTGPNDVAVNAAPYPYGTLATFWCPCGTVWKPLVRQIITSVPPASGIVSTVQAKCYGTLGWTTYDVTECVAASEALFFTSVLLGNAKIIFEPFNGTHLDAVNACMQRGMHLPLMEQPMIENLLNLRDLLAKWPCIRGPEVPIAQNIMMKLTPTVANNQTAFEQMWFSVVPNRTWWHTGEPAYNKTNLGGCAVFAFRNDEWKLGVKNCSEKSVTNAFLCFSTAVNASRCQKGTLELKSINVTSMLFNQLAITDTRASFGSVATLRCSCGEIWKDTENKTDIFLENVCSGPLGWMPNKIAECVSAPIRIQDQNYTYFYRDGIGGGNGITAAAETCFANSTGNSGSLAEATSVSQLKLLAMHMAVHCVNRAFMAPTAWRNMPGSLLRINKSLTPTEVNSIWLLNNGSGLDPSLPFAQQEPNNLGGVEHCLRLQLNDVNNVTSHSLLDVPCWTQSDRASHICAEPLFANGSNLTYCGAPANPTRLHAIVASMDVVKPSGRNASDPIPAPFPFGSVVSYTCPDGYMWEPVSSWPTDHIDNANTANIRTQASVTCLGTLGWTLYDVTKCVNATRCGPLPPVPPNVVEQCNVTSSGSYECVHVCSDEGPYKWTTGVASHKLTCDNATKTWSSYNDTCEIFCNSSEIRNFSAVLQTRYGTNRLGANVTYLCQENYAFGGLASSAGTNYSVHCQGNGSWTTLPAAVTLPLTCLPYKCNSSMIKNFTNVLQSRNGSQSLIGSSISYYCQPGFSFSGNSSLANKTLDMRCLDNATWSIVPENVTCLPYMCNASAVPSNPSGSIRSLSSNMSLIGSYVNFSCPQGTAFNGSFSAKDVVLQSTCQPNGTWSPLPLNKTCMPILCNPSEVRNITGTIRVWNGSTAIGTRITYQCESGLTFGGLDASLNANQSVECQTNSTWTPLPQDLACLPLNYGQLTNSTQSCNWTQIPSVPGAEQIWRGNATVGISITYKCGSGLAFGGTEAALNTNYSINCQNDSTWTTLPANLVCSPYQCDSNLIPSTPSGARRQTSGNFSFGSQVNFSCFPGLSFGGNASTTGLVLQSVCQTNGSWTPLPANLSCLPITNDPIPCNSSDIRNFPGVSQNSTGTSVGSAVTYYCQPGATLYGQSISWNNATSIRTTCLANGSWSEVPNDLTCLPSGTVLCNVSSLRFVQ